MENNEKQSYVMDSNFLANEKNIKSFMLKKYIIEYLTLALILFAVLFSRWLEFLDNATTGTLLGSVIGYFARDIKKIHS